MEHGTQAEMTKKKERWNIITMIIIIIMDAYKRWEMRM